MSVPAWKSLLLVLALPLLAAGASAQTGTVAGVVRNADTGEPLAEVRVEILSPAGQVMAGSRTDQNGAFRIVSVPAGTHVIVAARIGFDPGRSEGVTVAAGETTNLSFDLTQRPVILNPLVSSVSRQVEDAVSTNQRVEVVSTQDIEERPAVTPVDHLRAVPGVDIATHGVQSANIVTRGFNNIFSGSLFMLTDHRIAGVPSLRVNLMHMIPATNEDMERMEVVLGPGSALYGPNTANGVVHVFTRSPLTHAGTVLSLTGGERDLLGASMRTSHTVSPNFGFKVSGEYLRATEWEHTDPVEELVGATRDFDINRWSGEARADWRITSDFTSVFSVGRSHLGRAIELTGIGAAQVRDWAYTYYQARGTWGGLFGQVYLNTSDAGETFVLRSGEPIIDRSQLLVAQLQHGASIGQRQRFNYGADYLHTRPNTEGTIHGRYEDDDDVREIGAFLQSITELSPQFDFIAAGRIDDHNRLEKAVFSPRAALVFKPRRDQAVRVTFNRAFSTPRSLDLFLDIDAGMFPNAQLAGLGYGVRAQGAGAAGFTFQRPDGSYVMRSPFAPVRATPQNPSTILNADVPTLWDLGVGVLRAQGAIDAGTAAFLRSLQPGNDDIGRHAFDVLSGQVQPLQTASIDDVPVLQPTYTTSFEVGYKGILGDRLLLAADAWTATRRNFISALRPVTPLLLLDGPTMAAFMISRGVPPAQAGAIAAGMAQIPLGVVTADNASTATNRADFLVTYRNFGTLSLWGSDLAATLLLSNEWSLGASASYASRDVFETEGELITLNAPARKIATTLGYRGRQGVHGELRLRYNAQFPVLSAPFFATECIPDSELPPGWERSDFQEPCVESFTLVDMTLGYRIPQLNGTTIQLMVQNLFDSGYRSFPGVPEVRRMAVVRLRHEF